MARGEWRVHRDREFGTVSIVSAGDRIATMAPDRVAHAQEICDAHNRPPGLEVLVDTGAYGLPGRNWCRVVGLAVGGAAVYPVKVDVPGRGSGQFKLAEIHAQREGGGT